MFKKLYNKFFNNRKRPKNTIEKFEKALRPDKGISVVYEEITEHTIKGVVYKLGDRVLCRSNECDPLMIATIVEWWDNNGKWTDPIPQVKDELDGKVWTHMGTIVHHTDELEAILKPMRPLEQWNYLLPDNVKGLYSYSEEDMDRKEKQYENIQRNKEKLV
jgi:hypothetical protein